MISNYEKYLHIIFEERKYPKVSIFDELKKYIGDSDYFISFRDKPNDMYINKNNEYDTPHGFYCYPLGGKYTKKYINFKDKEFNFPFADDRSYIYILKKKPNIVVLDLGKEYTSYDLEKDIYRLKWIDKNITDETIKNAKRDARVLTDAGKIWNITRIVADYNPLKWNRILRKLGYDLVNDPGTGIVYQSEPMQSVFLSPSFEIVGIFHNESIVHQNNRKNLIKGFSYMLDKEDFDGAIKIADEFIRRSNDSSDITLIINNLFVYDYYDTLFYDKVVKLFGKYYKKDYIRTGSLLNLAIANKKVDFKTCQKIADLIPDDRKLNVNVKDGLASLLNDDNHIDIDRINLLLKFDIAKSSRYGESIFDGYANYESVFKHGIDIFKKIIYSDSFGLREPSNMFKDIENLLYVAPNIEYLKLYLEHFKSLLSYSNDFTQKFVYLISPQKDIEKQNKWNTSVKLSQKEINIRREFLLDFLIKKTNLKMESHIILNYDFLESNFLGKSNKNKAYGFYLLDKIFVSEKIDDSFIYGLWPGSPYAFSIAKSILYIIENENGRCPNVIKFLNSFFEKKGIHGSLIEWLIDLAMNQKKELSPPVILMFEKIMNNPKHHKILSDWSEIKEAFEQSLWMKNPLNKKTKLWKIINELLQKVPSPS